MTYEELKEKYDSVCGELERQKYYHELCLEKVSIIQSLKEEIKILKESKKD